MPDSAFTLPVFTRVLIPFSIFILGVGPAIARPNPTHADLVFATVEGQELKLDLFLPPVKDGSKKKPPLVIYIHGGGWSKGSYKKNLVPWMPEHGFALANIGYRLTDVETFPAQIHDVKAAVRWLRAHADEYGYDGGKIGVCGTSAGGHLALLLGTGGDVPELEGTVGDHGDQSSRVQAVVDYFGPADFVLRAKTQPAKTEEPTGGVFQLLGGKASEQPEKSQLASPAWHVTKDDPPLLILHGRQDTTVFIDQSERMVEAYLAADLPVSFYALPESRHGGREYFSGENRERVVQFFEKYLR